MYVYAVSYAVRYVHQVNEVIHVVERVIFCMYVYRKGNWSQRKQLQPPLEAPPSKALPSHYLQPKVAKKGRRRKRISTMFIYIHNTYMHTYTR